MNDSVTRKLNISLVFIIILCIILCVVSFALGVSAGDKIKNNIFSTGKIDVSITRMSNINVVSNIEPGMTIIRGFYVNNDSSIDVYYKVYFENLNGDLQNILTVKAVEKSSGTVLYEGLAKDFVKSCESIKAGEAIAAGESKEIELTFKFPEEADSEYGDAILGFDLSVTAVQAKNNPDKSFE